MKVSKQTSARHRAALLEAASGLFRERGFEGVSISDIAAAADLTHGAFYTHFSSKEALLTEALLLAFSDWDKDFRRLLKESVPAARGRINGA